MKKIKLSFISILLLTGCYKNENTFKSRLANAKYKIGDIITIDKGFYKGCTLKVEKIDPRRSTTVYWGKSECPISGASDEGTYSK